MMMKLTAFSVIILFALVLTACGESEPEVEKPSAGHVWKSQTDTIQQAKDTAADLEKTLQQRDQKIQQ